jgi:hypothetical protein
MHMKYERPVYLAAAGLLAVWASTPEPARAARRQNLSVDFHGDHCSDIKVKSDGAVARSAETFTFSRGEASLIEIQDTSGHAGMRVRGWDRPDYSVEACRVAAAEDRSAAEAAIRGISVTRSAGRFTSSGPSGDSANWQLYFIVYAPRDARLELETKNGPVDVTGISGSLKVRATNGPIGLKDVGGVVEANTANGPISFSGGGGEVHLTTRNGPISLELAGDVWNGSQLEARALNGPVSVQLPDTFRSGVRLETDGNGPVSCGSPVCRSAWTNSGSRNRTMQMNGAGDTIRISVSNGPVSISGAKKGRRI